MSHSSGVFALTNLHPPPAGAVGARIIVVGRLGAGSSDVTQPQCFWTKAATLQHLGQGPQLSEAQFSEVARLHAEASKLSRMEHSHIWEAEKSAKEAEAALDPRHAID